MTPMSACRRETGVDVSSGRLEQYGPPTRNFIRKGQTKSDSYLRGETATTVGDQLAGSTIGTCWHQNSDSFRNTPRPARQQRLSLPTRCQETATRPGPCVSGSQANGTVS